MVFVLNPTENDREIQFKMTGKSNQRDRQIQFKMTDFSSVRDF